MLVEEICGQSAGCIEELRGVVEALREVESAVGEAGLTLEASGEPPLFRELPEAVLRAAGRALARLGFEVDEAALERASRGEASGIDELFLVFVARRVARRGLKSLPRELSEEWRRGFCPICGLYPLAVVEAERSEDTSSRVEWVLHCVCGHRWAYHPLTCPRCGSGGFESFSVAIVGSSVVVYSCRLCGHSFAVFREKSVADETEREALPLLAYVAVNAVLSEKRA